MNKNNENNQLQIRNSTADFLIFTRQNDEDGIAVRVEDENVWLRSEAMAELFLKDRRTIQEHLKNIFADGELDEISVCRKFRHTADDGKNYQIKFYNLEAIISVGYRADSQRANAKKENMGLTNWKNAPHGKIIKTDVSIAKNYQSDFDKLLEQVQSNEAK